MFQVCPLVFGDHAGDRSQSPILVRLFKVRCSDASFFKGSPKSFKLKLVANSQIYVRRMMVSRTTIEIRVFNCGVTTLNSLLRDWDITARYCVQIMFEVLGFHNGLTSFCLRL